MLMGQVVIGGLWKLAIYGEGVLTQDLLGQRSLASERDPLFKCWLYPGPLVGGGQGKAMGG